MSKSDKLYVLIRKDLTIADQAVQAGHAVAKFAHEHPLTFSEWILGVNTLIYLNVEDQRELTGWRSTLDAGGILASLFIEPGFLHIDNPQATAPIYDAPTALAVEPNWMCENVLFKDLPLAFKGARRKRRTLVEWLNGECDV